jgi:hypothetical protein
MGRVWGTTASIIFQTFCSIKCQNRIYRIYPILTCGDPQTDTHLFTPYSGISSHSQGSSYYECLDEGEARQFSIPKLLYKIDMQARYDAARVTVLQYTLPVPIYKKTSSPYSHSDEDSDDSPPSLKRTDETEMRVDESLQIFIDALPHLEPLHYGFKLQASNLKGCCFLSTCKKPLPLEKKLSC